MSLQIDASLIQLAVLGFFTGFGTTSGTEIAKETLSHLRTMRTKIKKD